jgi:hypothetical protein
MDSGRAQKLTLIKRRYDMSTTTLPYNIQIMDNGVELASGKLIVTIDDSTNPPTKSGTFTPDGGTLINVSVPTWNTYANGAVVWNFTLSGANGDFPAGVYNFNGNENASGVDPRGNVNWPDFARDDFEETVTWQSEATQPVEESQARGHGAS